jgi:hypothetical protein
MIKVTGGYDLTPYVLRYREHETVGTYSGSGNRSNDFSLSKDISRAEKL